MSVQLYIQKPKKYISLTALIDVVFILLLFFMLTSSFSNWQGIELKSPAASDNHIAENPQLIRLHQDGALSMYRKPAVRLTDANIRALIDTKQPTVVLPESTVDVQLIITTLEYLSGFGIVSLSLGASLSSATE